MFLRDQKKIKNKPLRLVNGSKRKNMGEYREKYNQEGEIHQHLANMPYHVMQLEIKFII